jgi:membrane-associated phospholipid phosphatase
MSDAFDPTDFAERRAQALWWQGIAAAIILTLALVPWDVSISRAVHIDRPNAFTHILLLCCEKLGNGGFVVAILVALAILDRRIVSRLPQLLAASLGAGLVADILKLCVDRGRPTSLDLATSTFSSSFHGWFPLLSTSAREQSFPSGHATTAAGLAIALALLYPRWRWLFGVAVAAVMTQRVVVHAHFPTDVCVGAILGAVWSRQCHRGGMGRMFDRLSDKIDDLFAGWRNRKSRKATRLRADLKGARQGGVGSSAALGDDVIIIPETPSRRRSA